LLRATHIPYTALNLIPCHLLVRALPYLLECRLIGILAAPTS
jgi:hypothetical protein